MWELCGDAHTNWVRVLSGDHSHSWYDWNLRTQQNSMHHWAWRIWRCMSQCVGLASQLLYLPTALRYTWCKRCPSTWVSQSAHAYWTQNSVPHNAHHCYMHRQYRFMAYRQLTGWCWGWLGRRVRVTLPSCAVNKIRTKFPSADANYTGFKYPSFTSW